MILRFYARRLRHPGRHLVTSLVPDWARGRRRGSSPRPRSFEKRPAQAGVLPAAREYVLVEEYPYAGLSGWRWFVYRKPGTGIFFAPSWPTPAGYC